MSGKRSNKGPVANYDKAPNPPVYLPWRDPKKQYSMETLGIGYRRLLKLTRQNYATIPLIVVGALKFAWLDFFITYKLRNSPDLIWPHGDPEPCHKFEHKHTKFNRVDMVPILREHPRPRFEYEPPRRVLKFQWFPLSAKFHWSDEGQETHGSEESHDSGEH